MNKAPPFLPFSAPCIGQQEVDAVAEVLRSGWITTGPRANELETAYCRLTGCQHAIALYSATAGMHLALHAMEFKPGDEVITPSLTWVSTVNMIVATGAKPVFADIDRDSLMVGAEHIEPLISERTRLIVPVHYAGAPLDLDALRKLSAASGIALLEDAAHAIGAEYKSEAVGAAGTAIFSMHPIKNITTGEGGMFCTDDGALAERIRRLKFHGLGVDAFDRETRGRAPQAEVIEPGFKYNLPDMNAVLGVVQIKRLSEFIRKRRQLAARYIELFADVDEIAPLSMPDYEHRHAWHLFIVRLDIERCPFTRDEFMAALKAKAIGSGLHFRAVHLQKYYRDTMQTGPATLVNTEWNSERILSLPLFPDMEFDDVERVVTTIKAILSGGRS